MIAHAVPYPLSLPGSGSKLIVFNLIKQLSKKHKVYLICFCHDNIEQGGIKEIEKYCTSIEVVNINLKKNISNLIKKIIKQILAVLRNKPLVGVPYYSQKMRKKIQSAQEKNRFDMVYVSSSPMAQYVHDIKNDVFKLIAPYDSLSLWWDRAIKVINNKWYKLYCVLERNSFKKYEKRFYSLYNACQVVAEDDMRAIKNVCPNLSIYVIPNGVDTDYFKPLEKEREQSRRSIVFTGMLDSFPDSNSDAVIFFIKEIFPRILEKIPDLKFFIVGGYPPPQVLRLSSKNLIVTGYVKDIRPYIAEATVYISPLRIGTGIKNKVLEAMAMGKAIVATSIGCQGISVKNGEDIIISDNPEEMAGSIIHLLRDESERRRLEHNARQTAEKYSWQEVANLVVRSVKNPPKKILIPEDIPSLNKGEEAILLGILEGLKINGVDYELTLCSEHPDIDIRNYGKYGKIIGGGSSFRPDKKRSNFMRSINYFIILLRHVLFLAFYHLLGRKSLHIFRGELWKAYADADVIIVGHDAAFSDANLPFVLFIKSLRKQQVIYGMGFRGFTSFISKYTAKWILEIYDLIVVREESVVKYFDSIGVRKSKILLKPDPAFLFKPADQTKIETMIEKESIHMDGRPMIGFICVMTFMEPFNYCFEEVTDKQEKYELHVRFLAQLLDFVMEKTNARIICLPHCIGPRIRDDRIVARDVKSKLKGNKDDFILIENEYSASVLRGFIGKLDFLISERIHAVISAGVVGTPFMVLSVKQDMRAHDIIGKTLGMPNLIVNLNTPSLDNVCEVFIKLWGSKLAIKKNLLQKTELIHIECIAAGKLLSEVIKQSKKTN